MSDFTGHTIIVTGAASGIGRATTFELARRGACVVACDKADAVDEVVERVRRDGGEALAMRGDLTDPGIIRAAVERAADAGGQLGLVNNAGVMDGFQGAADVTDEVLERSFAINMRAPLNLVREVLPHMLAAKRGVIVNVGAEASFRGGASGVADTMAKHALVGLTRNTAYTYAKRGIMVNLIGPGSVQTNLASGFDPLSINPEHGMDAIAPVHQASVRTAEPEELARSLSFCFPTIPATSMEPSSQSMVDGWQARQVGAR